jgi:hypothetical protein
MCGGDGGHMQDFGGEWGKIKEKFCSNNWDLNGAQY